MRTAASVKNMMLYNATTANPDRVCFLLGKTGRWLYKDSIEKDVTPGAGRRAGRGRACAVSDWAARQRADADPAARGSCVGHEIKKDS